jgi:hAT family C-terminal dimerisation region
MDKKWDLIKLRERFHPLNAPPYEPKDVRQVAGKFYSLRKASSLQLQATQYSNAWKTNRWDDVLRPPVVAGAPRVYVDAVAFWDRDNIKREFPLIREIALYYLSVPLSTACVERTFSLLHIMDDDTRMAMGDALLENELFVRCHRKALEEKLGFLIAELREVQGLTLHTP